VVFARSEFGYDQDVTRWSRKANSTFADMDLTPLMEWLDWVVSQDFFQQFMEYLAEWGPQVEETETETGKLPAGLSRLFEIIVWCLVALLAITGLMVLYNNRKALSLARRVESTGPRPSVETVGEIRGPSTAEAPASTVPAQVWSTWTAGDPDTALAMLYNAALEQLASSRDLELDQAWTEGDCSRAIRAQVGGTPARYFQRVVRARTRISYAHRRPDDDEVRALCDDWSQLGGAS